MDINSDVIMEKIFGTETAKVFRILHADLICHMKAMAFADVASPMSAIYNKIVKAAKIVIASSVSTFLQKHYMSEGGHLNVTIDSDNVYDKNMENIPQLQHLKRYQNDLLEMLAQESMDVFSCGRAIALKMLERHRIRASKTASPGSQRDYTRNPPRELLSIEKMRLERKLPNLSQEEAERLRELNQQE